MYLALQTDSKFWQCPLDAADSGGGQYSLASPLIGRVELDAVGAQTINETLATISRGLVIPFGRLWLEKAKVLGTVPFNWLYWFSWRSLRTPLFRPTTEMLRYDAAVVFDDRF